MTAPATTTTKMRCHTGLAAEGALVVACGVLALHGADSRRLGSRTQGILGLPFLRIGARFGPMPIANSLTRIPESFRGEKMAELMDKAR